MSMIKKVMVFIDGENLTIRFQSMINKGFVAKENVEHEQDVYVWHPKIFDLKSCEIIRVNYYTSVVGDDDRVLNIQEAIKNLYFMLHTYDGSYPKDGHLFPCVYKKPKKSQKTKSVDINICVDILKHTYQDSADIIYLMGGDGDYLPVINEVMRSGKQILLAAFSDGLSKSLPFSVDKFINLDRLFFDP